MHLGQFRYSTELGAKRPKLVQLVQKFVLHGTRCKTAKTGAISAKVRATNLRRNSSQQMHPIHTIGS